MKLTQALLFTILFGALAGSAESQDGQGRTQGTATDDTTTDSPGLFPEPAPLTKGIDFAARRLGTGGEAKDGFYVEMGNMVTGAGWISAGPGYRRHVLNGRAVVDGSAAVSWRAYKMAQVRFEVPDLAGERLSIGSQVRWQDLTQVSYFGAGPDALESDRTEYRLKSSNVVGYATFRPLQLLSIEGRVGWLGGPSLRGPGGTFRRNSPATRELFPDDPVYARSEQPDYTYVDASVISDTRDRPGRPTRGGIYRAGWSAYSAGDSGGFSFRRYETEAAHFIPMADNRLILAVRGWLAASDTSAGETVPFYLMPALGGNNTLRGYTDYRFHDRNLLLFTTEARVAVFTHLDAALFMDAGNVAARVRDLDLGKRGYGVGFRVHARGTTFARFDIARATEGWRFMFRMNDPLHLSRLSRRTAPVPFAP